MIYQIFKKKDFINFEFDEEVIKEKESQYKKTKKALGIIHAFNIKYNDNENKNILIRHKEFFNSKLKDISINLEKSSKKSFNNNN